MASYFSTLPERTSAALLVVDNQTLQARAYVGTLAFGDRQRLGHVDMVQAWRSPGSTLKPFLYAMALDDGLIHSESLLVDAPQSFGSYRPGNFDMAFNGPIGASSALRLSPNVPSVDLLQRVGAARFAARLSHAGIQLRFPPGSTPNLSLILGGTGARLEDLVGAFAALNRNGIAGRVRYTDDEPMIERRLASPGASWIVREMLESNPRPGYSVGTFDVGGPPRGVEDRHQLRVPRCVGDWQHPPLHRGRVGGPAGRHTATGPVRRGDRAAADVRGGGQPAAPRGDSAAAPMPASVSQEDICWPTGERAEGCPRHSASAGCRLTCLMAPHRRPSPSAKHGAGNQVGSATCRRAYRAACRPIAACRTKKSRARSRAGQRCCRHGCQGHARSPQLRRCRRTAVMMAARPALRCTSMAQRWRHAGARAEFGTWRTPAAACAGQRAGGGWLLDGRWIAQTHGAQLMQREFAEPGTHTLTALAADGAWTQVRFNVLR